MQTHTDVNFHPKAFARVAHVKYNNGLFCARGVGMGASLAFCNFLLPLLIKKSNNKKSRKFEFLPNCTLNSSSWTPPTSFNAHYITYCFIAHIFFNIFGTYRTISFKFYENNLLRAIKQLFWVRDTESKSPQRNMLKQSITSPLLVHHTSEGMMIKPTHAVKAWTTSLIYPLRNNLSTQRIAYGNELQWVISTTALQTTAFLLL